MLLSEIFSMAFQNIRANMLRSVLTLLIIAFGIMALVGILTAIDAIAYSLNDNFSGLGANSFSIERKWGEVKSNRKGRRQKAGQAITFKQAQEFKERFDFPGRVSLAFWANNLSTVKIGDRKTNPNVGFVGVNENYFTNKGMDIEYGRGFSNAEIDDGQAKLVVGRELVKLLFKNKPEKALDQIVIVDNDRYRIIGVLKEKGSSMGNSSDRAAYAPLQNVKARYGTEETEYDLTVAVNNAIDMDAAQSEAMGLFRQIRGLRPGEEEDFEIFASDSLVGILKENTTNLRLATIAIGLMTLLGAAIGLMNIMLVSVTERTREIGLRLAIGALEREVLLQFLIEAVVLSALGGVIGIVLATAASYFGSILMDVPYAFDPAINLLSLLFAAAIGVLFGYFPARRAARLDPIEALRHE